MSLVENNEQTRTQKFKWGRQPAYHPEAVGGSWKVRAQGELSEDDENTQASGRTTHTHTGERGHIASSARQEPLAGFGEPLGHSGGCHEAGEASESTGIAQGFRAISPSRFGRCLIPTVSVTPNRATTCGESQHSGSCPQGGEGGQRERELCA